VVAGREHALGGRGVSRPALLLGIDEGTTAVKAALFDLELAPVAEARRVLQTAHPGPGMVEQDPEAVLEAVLDAVAEVLEQAPPGSEVVAGLAHQGESVLAWDARDGHALTPIVVWQDKRQEALLARLDERALRPSGLPLDPYFSAGKLAWLLANDSVVRRAAQDSRLRMGTVDAFIAERLGGRFATDLSTASRTQLLALGGRDWDQGLLEIFGLRREWLPAIGPTFGELGGLRCERWPMQPALGAQLVDQQAALAGSGTVRAGQAKATYGTGVFVLVRTEGPMECPGLLPTVAWAGAGDGGIGEISYALDGGVFSAGSLLEWLAGGLGLAEDVPALAALAAEVDDSAGVVLLPALAGLGSPWWRPGARGVIAGLHGGVRPAHLAHAALEAIAWRVADVVEAIRPAVPIDRLRVDGGLSNDSRLLQLQADALGIPLDVGRADATVRGAAMLAGVGAGVFANLASASALLADERTVTPAIDERERRLRRERWRAFVQGAAQL
jgi:glycerol kinase